MRPRPRIDFSLDQALVYVSVAHQRCGLGREAKELKVALGYMCPSLTRDAASAAGCWKPSEARESGVRRSPEMRPRPLLPWKSGRSNLIVSVAHQRCGLGRYMLAEEAGAAGQCPS